jgi:hypothetical protein
MTELAPVDNYQGSEPELVVFNIGPVQRLNPGADVEIFQTDGNSLWRVRVLLISGHLSGAAGTAQLAFAQDIAGQAGLPWTNSFNDSGIVSHVSQNLNFGDSFRYTWSSETQDAYFGNNIVHGRVAQAGLPLAFIPALTSLRISITRAGGNDSDLFINDGFLQIEKFPLSAVQAQGPEQEQRVFLLQAAKPGDAGGFA